MHALTIAFLLAASWNGVGWLGVTLGEPLRAVYARLGDPIATTADQKITTFVYSADRGNAFVSVLAQHGIVSGIRLWSPKRNASNLTDPKGVALHDDAAKLRAVYGKPSRSAADQDGPYDAYQTGDLLWLYHINGDGTVRDITVATTAAAVEDIPAQPVPVVHGGTSRADALLVVQPTDAAAANWERTYLTVHPCAGGRWNIVSQSRSAERTRTFDTLAATCPKSGSPRTFYFDTTRA